MADKKLVGVSGASGYIALHLVKQLLDQGYAVRGTLRSLSRGPSLQEALAKHTDISDLSFVEANLLSDEGWSAAVSGCEYFLHTASPVLNYAPKDEDELIIPAREGTLRVLKAASDANVKRVVLTSSVAAVYSGQKPNRVFTEEDWSDLTKPFSGYRAYAKSKTMAEQAAWDFVKGGAMELTVINPAMVIGPLIDPDGSASIDIVKRIIEGKTPGWPRLGFTFVDVRDVAGAHLLAMAAPEAAGKRYICADEFRWMAEIAKVLKSHLEPKGRRIKTWQMPDGMVRFVGLFDRTVRMVAGGLGTKYTLSSEKVKKELSWQPRPLEESLRETADSLIDHGIV